MYYLVTESCVMNIKLEMILGISNDISNLVELLDTRTRLDIFQKLEYSEKKHIWNVSIYTISKDNYVFLDTLYNKHKDIIYIRFENIKWFPDNMSSNFWYIPYINDGQKYFNDSDIEMIENIIKSSTNLT